MADFLNRNSLILTVNQSVILWPLKGVVAAGFGLLVDIFSLNGRVVFVCKILRTRKFDRHFQTFLVKVREDRLASPYNRPIYLAVSPSALVSYQIFALHTPCHSRPLNGTFHISTKSEILNLVLRQPFQIYEAFVLIHCFVWGFMLRIFQSMFTKIGYETIKKW